MNNKENIAEYLRKLAKKINLKKPLTAKEIKKILEKQYIERARKAGIIFNVEEKP